MIWECLLPLLRHFYYPVTFIIRLLRYLASTAATPSASQDCLKSQGTQCRCALLLLDSISIPFQILFTFQPLILTVCTYPFIFCSYTLRLYPAVTTAAGIHVYDPRANPPLLVNVVACSNLGETVSSRVGQPPPGQCRLTPHCRSCRGGTAPIIARCSIPPLPGQRRLTPHCRSCRGSLTTPIMARCSIHHGGHLGGDNEADLGALNQGPLRDGGGRGGQAELLQVACVSPLLLVQSLRGQQYRAGVSLWWCGKAELLQVACVPPLLLVQGLREHTRHGISE